MFNSSEHFVLEYYRSYTSTYLAFYLSIYTYMSVAFALRERWNKNKYEQVRETLYTVNTRTVIDKGTAKQIYLNDDQVATGEQLRIVYNDADVVSRLISKN